VASHSGSSERQLGLAAVEGVFDSVEPRVNDFVGQLKAVETLPGLGEFFLLTPVQLQLSFLVTAPAGVALGEQRGH
jgi:hypothetical protein